MVHRVDDGEIKIAFSKTTIWNKVLLLPCETKVKYLKIFYKSWILPIHELVFSLIEALKAYSKVWHNFWHLKAL